MKLSEKEKEEMRIEMQKKGVSVEDIEGIIEGLECEESYTTEEVYDNMKKLNRKVIAYSDEKVDMIVELKKQGYDNLIIKGIVNGFYSKDIYTEEEVYKMLFKNKELCYA